MLFYFYCVTNLVNQKIYVGVTAHPSIRWSTHKTIAKRAKENYPDQFQAIHAAISKYGVDNFIFEISKVFSDENEAYNYEFDQIAYMRQLGVPNYNLAPGGKGVSAGENHPRFGIKLSSEQIARMSEVMKGKMAGKDNPMFGKIHSESAKKSISLANTGRVSANRKFSEEQVREIKKLIDNGLSSRQIAKMMGVTKKTILDIKNKKYYRDT